MQTKKWYHSKMLYANLIGIVIIGLSSGLASEGTIQAILTAEASILAVVNLILRLVTKQGLSK